MKLGFKNTYLYSAVELGTGSHFTLEIPFVNADCLNVFLKEFHQQFPNDEILLVMDGAGWHKAKLLDIPHGIEIVYLPPYAPELNPVERLWEHLKNHTIRNKIYFSLSAAMNAVAAFLNSLSSHDIKTLCSINYLYY